MALKSTGEIVTWGRGPRIPAELTNVVSIAAGWDNCLFLLSDGTVTQIRPEEPDVPPSLNDVVAIAAGWHFNVALRRDGTVVQWPPTQDSPPEYIGLPSDLRGVTAISAHGRHAMALVGEPARPPLTLAINVEEHTGVISFPTFRGPAFLLESTSRLGSPEWRIEALRHGTGESISLEVPCADTRFFRLRTH